MHRTAVALCCVVSSSAQSTDTSSYTLELIPVGSAAVADGYVTPWPPRASSCSCGASCSSARST